MKIDFSKILNLKAVIITATCSLLVIWTTVYLSPGNQGWWNHAGFSWGNTFKFILIDQILIECISVFIIFLILKIYVSRLRMLVIPSDFRSVCIFLAKCFPVTLIAFFLFNPVTQTLRFIYHNFNNLDLEIYFSEYFYSVKLYLTYFPVVLIQLYGAVAYLLFDAYSNKQSGQTFKKRFLEGYTEKGNKLIPIDEIIYVEKIERKYFLQTKTDVLRTNLNITQLQNILPSDEFVRINRAAIVKISAIKGYSFWENEKYNLTLTSGKEFTMSRVRLNKIKDSLQMLH